MQDPTHFEEEEDTGMTAMVNISDDPIVVRVSRGRRVQKVTVKPGGSHLFEAAYCEDVKGAGRHSLLPILTRQSLREDRIPRLVREDQAEKARDYFETRTYGTADDNDNEEAALEAALASVRARREVLAKRRRPSAKPSPSASASQAPKPKSLKKMNLGELQDRATANGIDPEQTKAQLIAELEAREA